MLGSLRGSGTQRVAEEWAWQEAKSNGIDLVSICPNFGERCLFAPYHDIETLHTGSALAKKRYFLVEKQ